MKYHTFIYFIISLVLLVVIATFYYWKSIRNQGNDISVLSGEQYRKVFVSELKNTLLIENNNVSSYIINSEDEVGEYEQVSKSKEKSAQIVFNFIDENGKGSVVFKKLNLTDESIVYALDRHTDYFKTGDLSYIFEPDKENFYKLNEDYVNYGNIFISEEKYIIIISSISQDNLDRFFVIYEKDNDRGEDLITYLQSNNDLERIHQEYQAKNNELTVFEQNIPSELKRRGIAMYMAYINLDIDKLREYYANTVWFFVDDEWEKSLSVILSKNKQFVNVKREELFTGYIEEKEEEFEEEYDLNKKFEENLRFYKVKDVLNVCSAENKKKFLKYFHTRIDDYMMVIVSRGFPICTVDGKFYYTERMWLFREIAGSYKVVVDKTE